MFQEAFKGVSREFHGYPEEVQNLFQGGFKNVLIKFQVSLESLESVSEYLLVF